MRSSDVDFLIVPGWGGSGPDHWQTRWRSRLATARLVEQDDWERPSAALWVPRIAGAIGAAARPAVVIAHSLGVLATVQAVQALADAGETAPLAGLFLVAPPSADAVLSIPEIDDAFGRLPRSPLPVPALLIASRNDPYGAPEPVAEWATALGAEFVDAGDSGHINSDSGHGPWPEGLMRLAGFLKTLPPRG